MSEIQSLVRENIKTLKPYSSARDEFTGYGEVFLDANENPFGQLNRYPDPYQRKLRVKLSEINGLPVDQIFIGNGSDEIIDLSFRIFCKPDEDKVVTFSPTYGMYDVSATINDVEIVKIPLNEEFQIDLPSSVEVIEASNPKLIFICSPNNPTGNLLKANDIDEIIRVSMGIVIIDEAYIDFCDYDSWSKRLAEYQNLIVMQTFSKARALAGARVGMMYSSKEVVDLFNKVKPPYNISTLNIDAAIASLENGNVFEEHLNIILSERRKLEVSLNDLKIVVKVYPSDTNFLLVEFTNANDVYEQLVRRKVIVRNRNNIINNCLRITVGSPDDNRKLIEELITINKEIK